MTEQTNKQKYNKQTNSNSKISMSDSDLTDQHSTSSNGTTESSFIWESFLANLHGSPLLFDEHKQPIEAYSISPHLESNLRIENGEWVFYKRNHLKVSASFNVSAMPKYMLDNNGCISPINRISMFIFGVSQLKGNFESVPIFKMNAKRNEKLPIEPVDITPGVKVTFSHIHFERSTHNNGKKSSPEDQEHFRLVICTDVSLPSESARICAYCSPGFVLRGCSPKSKKNSNQNTDSTTSPTSNEASSPSSQDIDIKHKKRKTEEVEEEEKQCEEGDESLKQLFDFSPLSSPEEASPETADENKPNQESSNVTNFHGKVGINVDNPSEALHVKGNMIVTGNVYTPSDVRVKTNIELLDTKKQLATIKQLKLYQYNLNTKALNLPDSRNVQHGVLAQEIEKILPRAVIRTVGRIDENGNVSELLVVDKDALYMENIGATVELSKQVDYLNDKVDHLNNKVNEVHEVHFKPESEKLTFFQALKLSFTTLPRFRKLLVIFLFALTFIFLISSIVVNL